MTGPRATDYSPRVSLLPLVFSTAWASGVNAFLAVLLLGLIERFNDLEQIPDQLARTDVLIGAAVLFLAEFVADKIPYLDSTWDAVSTVVRPTIGTALALMLAGDAESLDQAAYAVLGGTTSLASHAVKAGGRLAINTSPEPFTNVAASLSEDVAVVGVILLAINHPWLALIVCVLLLVAGATAVVLLLGVIRRGWRRWKGRTGVAGPPP